MTDCRTTLVTTTAAVADPLRSAGERRDCRLFGCSAPPSWFDVACVDLTFAPEAEMVR
jgi:hypothetical protein